MENDTMEKEMKALDDELLEKVAGGFWDEVAEYLSKYGWPC